MLFSVIIPAFNVEKHIAATLDSLKAQTLKEAQFEIIIVNDGSTDGTHAEISRKISADMPNAKLLDQENSGVSHARNQGLREAKGDYVYFLDGDDYIAPDFLQLMSDAIASKSPQLLISSYGKVVDHKISRNFTNTDKYDSVERLKIAYLKGRLFVNMCTFVFKRECINEWQLSFDEKTKFGEDLEFYQNFLFLSSKVEIVEKACFYYVFRGDSAFNSKAGIRREDALLALIRVQERLKRDCQNETIINAYRDYFFPQHILKVVFRVTMENDRPNAVKILKKYRPGLKAGRLSGKDFTKSKFAYFFPRAYVATLFFRNN